MAMSKVEAAAFPPVAFPKAALSAALCVGHVVSPLAADGDDVVVERGLLGGVEEAVLARVEVLEGDARVGAGKGSDGSLELAEVKGTVGIAVDNVPVLVAEFIQEDLVVSAHSDEVSDGLSAGSELSTVDGAIGAGAEVPEGLEDSIGSLVNNGLELGGVGGGEFVDVVSFGPPLVDDSAKGGAH